MEVLAFYQTCFDYTPQDSALFNRALTHRSYSADHNERLEFVGDAVLDLIIAEVLFVQFLDKPEGELSRYRAELVRSTTLADIAKEIQLPTYIRLGEGERKSGGCQRESILAGALEAIIGAIYFESGFDLAKQAILPLFKSRLQSIHQSAQNKDPKTTLQELMQANGYALPQYELLKTVGKDHKQTFIMVCHVEAFQHRIQAEGASKKMAQQQSAALMLDWIREEKKL